jgi:hypothetical protein
MKTSRLITITAAIIACAAPAASARPAIDPPARPHVAAPVNSATIAAHREQLSTEQYLASRGQSAPATPLTDRTADTDGRFPTVFVLLGLTIPLGIVLARIASKPVRAYTRHRRRPASAA